MRSLHAAFLASALGCMVMLAGCSGEDDHGVVCPEDDRAGLILHPETGIPGHYLVKLPDALDDVALQVTALQLAQEYDGEITAIWLATVRGFAMTVADERAPALAAERAVCWVEQDGVVSGE